MIEHKVVRQVIISVAPFCKSIRDLKYFTFAFLADVKTRLKKEILVSEEYVKSLIYELLLQNDLDLGGCLK